MASATSGIELKLEKVNTNLEVPATAAPDKKQEGKPPAKRVRVRTEPADQAKTIKSHQLAESIVKFSYDPALDAWQKANAPQHSTVEEEEDGELGLWMVKITSGLLGFVAGYKILPFLIRCVSLF